MHLLPIFSLVHFVAGSVLADFKKYDFVPQNSFSRIFCFCLSFVYSSQDSQYLSKTV